MTPEGARHSLLHDADLAKEIGLNDGTKFVVRNREQWLVSPHYLIVLDKDGFDCHLAYRNIAYIRPARGNGRRGPRSRGR